MAAPPYTTILAPVAYAAIEIALTWWARHRRAARDLLVRELEAALRTIELAPQVGRHQTRVGVHAVQRG